MKRLHNSFKGSERQTKKRKFFQVSKKNENKLETNLKNVKHMLKNIQKKDKFFSSISIVLWILPIDIVSIIKDYASTFRGVLVKKIPYSRSLHFELNEDYLNQDLRIISKNELTKEIIFAHSLIKFWFLIDNNTCNKIYFENGSNITLFQSQIWSHGTLPFHALILDSANIIIWCQNIKLLWWIDVSNLVLHDLELDRNLGFLNSIWKADHYLFVAQGDFMYIFE